MHTGFSQTPADSLYRVNETKHTERKWLPGGTVSMQFNPTFINISPLISYKATSKLIVGGGGSYMYAESQGDGSKHIYGGRVYAAHRLVGMLSAQLEAEALNHSLQNSTTDTHPREWVCNPLAGVSYALPVSKHTFLQLTVLYNFNYSHNTFNRQLYHSPWIFRVGASF